MVQQMERTHATHGRRRGEAQVVGLKDKVDIIAERDALAIRQRQEMVVVED